MEFYHSTYGHRKFRQKKHNCPHNVKGVVQTVIILDIVAHNALLTYDLYLILLSHFISNYVHLCL